MNRDNERDRLWKLLGNVPVNEEGELEEDFLTFETGTDREEIWAWFEEEFNCSIGKLYF